MRRIIRDKCIPPSLCGAKQPSCEREIDNRLYSADDVKKRLLSEQYHKCAYCECLLNGDYGHIEHYRPKGGYTTLEEPYLHKPGYVWLAHDWSNLLLSCSTCNSSFKRNQFDLEDESKRNIAARDISQESPLLINPIIDNPQEHIEYRGYFMIPRIVNGLPDRKGAYTIYLLGLNSREELLANRKRVWEHYCKLKIISELLDKELSIRHDNHNLRTICMTVRKQLEQMAAPQAEYSAMIVNNTVSSWSALCDMPNPISA